VSLGAVAGGRHRIVLIEPAHALQQLKGRLRVGHLRELAGQHLFVFRNIELHAVILDKDLLEARFQIVPPKLAGTFHVHAAGGLQRRTETLDAGGLIEFRGEVRRLAIAGLDLIDDLLDALLGGWRARRGACKQDGHKEHAADEHRSHGYGPSSTPTRLTSTSRRPSLAGAPTMPSCSIISTRRAALG